eukprot:Amastigsp_a186558_9.p2 type:complete len:176 gc:universal Amastigsp_a186558_9:437-964(+)
MRSAIRATVCLCRRRRTWGSGRISSAETSSLSSRSSATLRAGSSSARRCLTRPWPSRRGLSVRSCSPTRTTPRARSRAPRRSESWCSGRRRAASTSSSMRFTRSRSSSPGRGSSRWPASWGECCRRTCTSCGGSRRTLGARGFGAGCSCRKTRVCWRPSTGSRTGPSRRDTPSRC